MKLNRKIIHDALQDFIKDAEGAPFYDVLTKEQKEAYISGANDMALALQQLFPKEKNIHLSVDGDIQNRYRFHYNVGVLPTSVEKWMTPENAKAFAKRKGYRLELVRTTHKPV